MGNFTPTKLKLKDLLSDIDCGKLKLPSFQRDYKWTAPKVKKLLDSIQCDHPAGTLLFLAVDYNNLIIPDKSFDYTEESKQNSHVEHLVLDGQQRLTSCYCVFYNLGNKSYFLDYAKLMELDKTNNAKGIEFEELIVDKKHMDFPDQLLDKGLMPLSFIKDTKTMRDLLKPYKDSIRRNSEKEEIYDFLDGRLGDYLDTILEYEFPVVILPKELTLDAVCKVFQTINSTGLKLSVFDICVAKFMRQGIQLKDRVEDAKRNSYVKIVLDNEETLVLQAIALLSGKTPKKNALADTLDKNDIETYWDKVIDGIRETMELLDRFGVGTTKSLSLLPYKPFIPLIAAVLVDRDFQNLKIDAKTSISQKIKEFFFCTALTSRYTEGTDNKLKEDYQILLKWITGNQVPTIVSNGILWNTSKYIGTTKQSAFGKAVLCLINAQNPNDFYEDKNVGIGENTVSSQIHHIFPEAEYKQKEGENINSVFNYTFLTNEANNFISDKATYKYVDEIMKLRGISKETFKEILSRHVIDEDSFNYIYQEDFSKFLEQRAECVKNKFADIGIIIHDVAKEQIDEQVDDEDLVDDIEQ
ncbi:MAG: DUF262 domain-containing protein [Lachnospiraceae bacterium]|nr:DUF262 domain-containing protein [Lachnospiraceae bacterium]